MSKNDTMITSPELVEPPSTLRQAQWPKRFHFRPLKSPMAYLFVLPAMVIFAVFTIFPTIYAFGVSTYKWNYLNSALSQFVGLANYKAMVQGLYEPSFGSTMVVSLYFVSAMVVLGTVLSLLLAVLLHRASTVLLAVRSALFLTYVTPLVATSLVWVWMFNPRFGLANVVIQLFGITPVDWLNDTHTAMPSIIVYSLWHELGFTTIVFVGGLTTISTELSEAARIDGAGPAREFLFVTLPQLRPFVIFVVVIGSVSSLHAFTQFFVLTGGGPGYDTSTLGFQLYQQAFVLRNTGYAAALAVVLFLITILLSLAQLAASRSLRSSVA